MAKLLFKDAHYIGDIHPKTFILKSSIKTSLLRPLKGLRLIVPGRYTNPSITSDKSDYKKNVKPIRSSMVMHDSYAYERQIK